MLQDEDVMKTSNSMNLEKADRATLKAVIKEILLEDKSIVKDAIAEMLTNNPTKSDEERLEKLNKIIDKHFDEYDEVFKALA